MGQIDGRGGEIGWGSGRSEVGKEGEWETKWGRKREGERGIWEEEGR